MSRFGVPDSVLGHLFQHRYGLLLLLREVREKGPMVALSIERADDLALEDASGTSRLVQTKHSRPKAQREARPTTDRDGGLASSNVASITPVASLTNASPDLWKTLRVWAEGVKDGTITMPGTVLTLVATSIAPEASAASLLRPSLEGRDVLRALELLRQTMSSTRAEENKKAFAAFRALDNHQQRQLLDHVNVLDGSPSIGDVRPLIERELLLAVDRDAVGSFFLRLEGWWHSRVLEHLAGPESDRITGNELVAKIDDLRRQFQMDNLPIDADLAELPLPVDSADDAQMFVRQLLLVGMNEPGILFAVRDYYRAYEQRSRWVRDDLLYLGELERYERKLIEAWQHAFNRMQMATAHAAVTEVDSAGQALYFDLTGRDIRIRQLCDEPFVMRGCFHLLADKLVVGWHADFVERLKSVLNNVAGGGPTDVTGTIPARPRQAHRTRKAQGKRG